MNFVSILREGSEAAGTILARWSDRLPPMGTMPQRSMTARALLYDLLQGVAGDAAADWRLEMGSSGRPTLSSPNVSSPALSAAGTGFPFPSVSIAHSGGWVMCGLSRDGDIGIDLEELRSGRDWPAMAETAFGPREVQRAAADGMPGFYRLWTLREAMAKATGAGWAAVTDRQDRADGGPDTGTWSASHDGSSWSLWHERMICRATRRQFSIAVACRYRAKTSPTSHMPLKWWHLSRELQMMGA
ncbi:MAG: 4'-phosphopantetheinyl transferase superfamily protein [Rhodospirillaceae bacterium]|nr:MAG: 4'-phosphopantetheinyl transferase superfamily protein [Rhodospirillaceae bacterium]